MLRSLAKVEILLRNRLKYREPMILKRDFPDRFSFGAMTSPWGFAWATLF
jgi:hypothetical protein